jgi:predicted nucleic acid-binding protein
MLVIDASALVAYLTGAEGSGGIDALIETHRDRLIAPHLVDAEAGHALRRLVAAGEIEEQVAAEALADLAELALERSAHIWLLERAWSLRSRVSFYDALYLALAQELEAHFVTLDARLARAAAALSIEVESLESP